MRILIYMLKRAIHDAVSSGWMAVAITLLCLAGFAWLMEQFLPLRVIFGLLAGMFILGLLLVTTVTVCYDIIMYLFRLRHADPSDVGHVR